MSTDPKTVDELASLIAETIDAASGYEGTAQALHDVTEATFNFAAGQLGNTGFQASWAVLRLIGTVNRYDGPYAVLKAEDMVFPQYPTPAQAAAQLEVEWKQWAADRAREKLAEKAATIDTVVHPNVLAHWRKLDRETPPALTAGQEQGRG